MKLEEIGFYTLSDERARSASQHSALMRCELILTDKCNFNCSYCRGLREDCQGEMPLSVAEDVLVKWHDNNLKNVRFSGGEPTLHPYLHWLIRGTKFMHMERIAVSTNGSADLSVYENLISEGVNDFSISLDSCCAATSSKMNGITFNVAAKVITNIKELSKNVYVTVGIVLNGENMAQALETIRYAHDLGVSDIRIIPSAQYGQSLEGLGELEPEILAKHPILRYRVNNIIQKRPVRGIGSEDCKKCYLVLDDMAVAGEYHFPCVIYLREGGDPIGRIDSDEVRHERFDWFLKHDSYRDVICQRNCLDVCVDYNNKVEQFKKEK